MVRNLQQYPITKEEKLNLLEEIYLNYTGIPDDEPIVGDIRPAVVLEIINDVRQEK